MGQKEYQEEEPRPEMPVVSFVGLSGSGKTTMLEKVIAELTARGLRVGVIKHTTCRAEFDAKGKDTLRLREAGAAPVAIQAPNLLAVFQPLDEAMPLDAIIDQFYTAADIVITEGFKSEGEQQIVVLGARAENVPDPQPENVIAYVCDESFGADVPVFGRNDAAAVADFIQKTFLKPASRSDVRVWADGKYIPVKPFVKAFIGRTVKAMLGSLRGVNDPEKIHLKIGR